MAEYSFIRFLKYQLLKLKSFLTSKNVLSFFVFLALSTAFWFVNALDKERETTITIPIRYVGVPQHVVFTNSPPNQLKLSIKDQGIRLMDYTSEKLTPLTIDLNRVFYEKGDILITSHQLSNKIAHYILPTTIVNSVTPDSIVISYEKLKTATLPVELDAKIELAQQYALSSSVQLDPKEITVFGPKRILDTLKVVRTEYFEFVDLTDTVEYKAKLKPIQSVRYLNEDIKVNIFVEMFTEKTVQLPIITINCPSNLLIRTFPAMVNVTFNVGLSHFNDAETKDLQIVFDYYDIKSGDGSRQKLKVINNSSYISNVQINPEEVEFIIERQ